MKCKLLPALLLALLALATPAFAAGFDPLGNPVNLQWDKDHPGLVRWETELPYQGFCYLSFYQENDPSPIWSAQLEHGAGESGPFEASYFKYHALASQDLPSGNYFFTVQNLGDGTAYSDSAEVSSGVYAYVEPGPDTALETPAAGHWEWPIAVWDDRQDTDPDVDGYLVEYGWSKTEAAAARGTTSLRSRFSALSARAGTISGSAPSAPTLRTAAAGSGPAGPKAIIRTPWKPWTPS